MNNSLPPYSLLGLPTDILVYLLHEVLLIKDLSALSRTSRFFHALVNEFGWAGHQRRNPRPSMSLSKSRVEWTPMASVKYDVLTDRSWSQSEFIARPLSGPWPGTEQPRLAINPSRLVVATGTTIYSYTFGVSMTDEAPPIVFEGSCSLARTHRDRANFITALTFVSDGGQHQTLSIAFRDGTLERIVLAGSSKRQGPTATLRVYRSPQSLHLSHKDLLESLSSSRNALLSLSASGRATLTNIDTFPASFSSLIDLQVRSWVSHLSMDSTSPYAAFGTSSATPLAIHSITNDQLSPLPSAVLSQAESTNNSAVYGICKGPPSSLWGPSPQIVVSGWYNGTVSIHDLRSCSRSFPTDAPNSPAPLRPVLTLANSWSIEPIYSVSCGGGAGSHVAAGSARHSLLSLWDIRSPTKGFSVHAPLNDRSPVYAVVLESSRLFGVTQSRPFVLDFGPGITQATYPDLGPSSRGFSHLNQKGADGFGYYVTKYQHACVSQII